MQPITQRACQVIMGPSITPGALMGGDQPPHFTESRQARLPEHSASSTRAAAVRWSGASTAESRVFADQPDLPGIGDQFQCLRRRVAAVDP
jgi:hypothetical protein